jgi:hypothetical protein
LFLMKINCMSMDRAISPSGESYSPLVLAISGISLHWSGSLCFTILVGWIYILKLPASSWRSKRHISFSPCYEPHFVIPSFYVSNSMEFVYEMCWSMGIRQRAICSLHLQFMKFTKESKYQYLVHYIHKYNFADNSNGTISDVYFLCSYSGACEKVWNDFYGWLK